MGRPCSGRSIGWPLYQSLACQQPQWAITSRKGACGSYGAITTYVGQQGGEDGRQSNLLAYESTMTSQSPTINDRPDQTGQIAIEQTKQAKRNAIVMNKMLTKIDQGREVLRTEEYKIAVKQEPKRVFPFSDVMEATLDDKFHAKNEDLPKITTKRSSEQGSYFGPRYKKEQKTVNTDVMSRLTNWAAAIRDMFVAVEHVLQTKTYENTQKRDTPSIMSQDLLLVKKLLEEGIRTREILGTRVEDMCANRKVGTACTGTRRGRSSTEQAFQRI